MYTVLRVKTRLSRSLLDWEVCALIVVLLEQPKHKFPFPGMSNWGALWGMLANRCIHSQFCSRICSEARISSVPSPASEFGMLVCPSV